MAEVLASRSGKIDNLQILVSFQKERANHYIDFVTDKKDFGVRVMFSVSKEPISIRYKNVQGINCKDQSKELTLDPKEKTFNVFVENSMRIATDLKQLFKSKIINMHNECLIDNMFKERIKIQLDEVVDNLKGVF